MKEKIRFANLKSFFLLLLSVMLLSNAYAQQADEELAAQFLANKEYSKAANMYEKLLGSNARSIYFYDNLLKCYLAQNNFTDAQKLVKKQSRKFDENPFYLVDQGYILTLQNETNKAKDVYDNLIKKLLPNENAIYDLAKAFEKRNEKSYAIETYLNGRKLLHNEMIFASELAGLYNDIRQIPNMIEEYLNVLIIDETYQEEVQGFLQNSLQTKEDFEILKLALVKKSKLYNDKSCFPEMLIWLYVQRNEYDLALIYAKSLDKKNKERGRRILELGFMANANLQYDAAINCYKQVQLLGADLPYYSYAKNSELEARTNKILAGNYTHEDLKQLEIEYNKVLNEFGKNTATANTLRSLAKLQAFYLNNYTEAIKNYEEIILMPRVDRNLQADCKLELGDFYVMRGEVWEAMLLYGQVDKDFLQEPLGQEAKFRNAKLSYYLGEFDWAKAQLDILKTATTQLIANNALELSLLIQDNTVDSNTEPLSLFAQADLNYVQNNDEIALRKLDSIGILFPKHSLSDEIIFKKAQIFERKKDFQNAAKYYEIVVNEYGSDILGDNALYCLALLYHNKLNKPEEAKKCYEKFIDNYPGSFFLSDCRKQYRLLRGDQIN